MKRGPGAKVGSPNFAGQTKAGVGDQAERLGLPEDWRPWPDSHLHPRNGPHGAGLRGGSVRLANGSFPEMGRPTGLEPATPRFTILCSNQLSYDRRKVMEREPSRPPKALSTRFPVESSAPRV